MSAMALVSPEMRGMRCKDATDAKGCQVGEMAK